MKELLDTTFINISLDKKSNTLVEQWKLHFGIKVEEQTFREPMELILKTLKEENGITKYLSITTERKSLIHEDQLWMENTFYPSLSNIGLERLAIVSAKDVQEISLIKNMLHNLNESISIDIFNKANLAKNWLDN